MKFLRQKSSSIATAASQESNPEVFSAERERESKRERKREGGGARGLRNKYSVCISMSGGVSRGQGDRFLLVMRLLKRGNDGPEGAPLLLLIPRIPNNSEPTPQASAGVLSIFILLPI